MAYQVSQVVFGPECPAFAVVFPTQDLPQFLEESKKCMEQLGPECSVLIKKLMSQTRRLEERMNVSFLPELCYYPESK